VILVTECSTESCLANKVPHFATVVVCFCKLIKFQDFQVPTAPDSSAFNHLPCFQVLSRP